jgi:cytochrome c-type biogenesis protein CcmF
MTVLLGNFALSLAVLISAAAAICSVAAARFESAALLRMARVLFVIFAGLITVASGALVAALVNSNFQIEYVAHYTERALPLGYKLAAFWAGQAGSLLLWCQLLAVLATAYVIVRRRERGIEVAAATATLALVSLFFAGLILFAANPFETLAEVPADGLGLNPMLQDWGMIAHPPLLFFGYAGFTIPLAALVGALVAGRSDNLWIGATRRWILSAWLTLSVGILLGARWAYVELGWGGYWAWDPVENASLLPWLTATGLLHSIIAQQHRGIFKRWNAALIVATFVLCIFGTYLTRSGVIQSVHSFGQSVIGTFFLTFLVVAILASAAMIVLRRRLLRPEHELETLFGREGVILAANVLLLGMTAVTLIGTIFPLISQAVAGTEVTVGPRFYNKVVAPIGLLLAAMMAAGPLLTYGKDAGRKLVRRGFVPAIVAAAVVIDSWMRGVHSAWALVCVAIATAAVIAVLMDLIAAVIARRRSHRENALVAFVRLLDSNHRRYGGQLVHLGVILVVIGITGSSVFSQKQSFQLQRGQQVTIGGATITLNDLTETRGVNYSAVEAQLVLLDSATGRTVELRPQRRFYDKAEDANSEVAIDSTWRRDVYLTLAGWESGGAVTAIQVLVNPLVSWLWTGGWVIAFGAVFALLPRLLPQQVALAAHAALTTSISGRPAPARQGASPREWRTSRPTSAGVHSGAAS